MNSLSVLYLLLTNQEYSNYHYKNSQRIQLLEIYLEPPVLYTLIAEDPC